VKNSGTRKTSPQAKTRYYQNLGSLLWQNAWLVFLGLSLAGWCLFAFRHHPEDFGLSQSFFGIFSSLIATLLGILLGLIVAAVVFIMQNALTGWRASKDKLSSEVRWLESFVGSELSEFADLQAKVRDMIDICDIRLPFIFRRKKPIGFSKVADEIMGLIGRAIDDIEREIELKGKMAEALKKVETAQGGDAEEAQETETSATVDRIQDDLDAAESKLSNLGELNRHVGNMLEVWTSVQASSMSMGFARMFVFSALLSGLGLLTVLAVMFWGGMESAGEESVSNIARLRAAGFEVWILMASLLWAFKNVTFYIEVLRDLEVPDELESLM
jgi:ABC-type multidrug transport system fused ATPase/permease subunit